MKNKDKRIAKSTFITKESQRLIKIVKPLLAWYAENARDLPWRKDSDPYRIWISEIMLQQTRVEAVIPYYNRFIRQVPDIRILAELPEERLLKLWEGLGYYRRARNMQKSAQMIMDMYDGKFPEAYGDILSLPGIGDYTASAITSICFGLPTPAVDGNVLRVFARLTGYDEDISALKSKKNVTELLSELYPGECCGDFTQSLMELGATVCLPNGQPKCGLCPLSFLCVAYQTNSQQKLPVKAKKKPRKKEQRTVFLLCCGEKLAVRQRAQNALLGGLWEFPNIEGHLSTELAENVLRDWGVFYQTITEGIRSRHIFTHIEWDMKSYIVICKNMNDEFLWVTKEKLSDDIALPSAFKPFVRII